MLLEYIKGFLNKKKIDINDFNQGVEVVVVIYFCLYECVIM